MNFRTLKDKRIVDGKVVMTEPTTVFFNLNPDTLIEHTVSLHELDRPDLIALKYYSTDTMLDILLKFNGISNPFSINEGDILFIPVNITSFKKFIKPSRSSKETQKEKFLKQRRMTEKDIKRFEYLQSIAQVEALPPNRLKTGQVNKDATSGPITDLNPSQV